MILRKNSTIIVQRLRLFAVVVCVVVGSVFVGAIRRPATAASPNLAWAPYLQQLTDTSVTILWTSHDGNSSTVRYSTDSSYGSTTDGTSRALSALGTQLHRVVLTGLQPDTTYYYKVYTDDEDLLPDRTLSFHTAPPTGSTSPFT